MHFMAPKKEAAARVRINKLLEESDWHFFDDGKVKANITLEANIRFEDMGDDFESAESKDKRRGVADFLLHDIDGKPLAVLEAKRESIDPLSSKEQARDYARATGARFIILSNGNLSYFWDTESGNPEVVTRFPTPESITQFQAYRPDLKTLAAAEVDENYIIASQRPNFAQDPDWRNEATRPAFVEKHGLRQLRPYQLAAIHALQRAAAEGQTRYLFEMATGTGKTLTAAAVIRLFLKTGNARRVLFLVDRLELEDQAKKSFIKSFKGDYIVKVFKEDRDTWQSAAVVVTTIQSLLAGDRYRREFSPTDFELVISDEAHRSIGGNSRVVFEYFVGFKLGLTATPKDYLRGYDAANADTRREFERRQLLDTYRTFGCASGEPTFRYSLLDGVKDRYLVNPVVVDARTEITSQLLSEEGYAAVSAEVAGDESGESYFGTDFERRLFNEDTNRAMCQAFLDHGLLDPMAAVNQVPLFGKSIVFCVSQSHAARVVQHLNEIAAAKWPEHYGKGSDFAVQITSLVAGAQQMTVQFANNQLLGRFTGFEGYDTSRVRVAVTVGMMTTGYDCEDLLNLALMRPIFSPSDFIQMKGRGTRRYSFKYEPPTGAEPVAIAKANFKLFDFFANCEYFEKDFNYDEKLSLPKVGAGQKATDTRATAIISDNGAAQREQGNVILNVADTIASVAETAVGAEGMAIDRAMFRTALNEDVVGNAELKRLWETGNTHAAEEYARTKVFDHPKWYLNPEKAKRAFSLDRRLTVREILEYAFGLRDRFENRDELLEGEWSKFVEVSEVKPEQYDPLKHVFKAYLTDEEVRQIIDRGTLPELNFTAPLNMKEYEAAGPAVHDLPRYIKDYVNLNRFLS